MKSQKSLYEWLQTKVIINIRNEENFALKRSFKSTYARIVVFGVISFILFIIIYTWLLNSILGAWINPEYEQVTLNRKINKLNNSVDSLAQALKNRDKLIHNFQQVLNGTDGDKGSDEGISIDPNSFKSPSLDEISPSDSLLRIQFEQKNSTPLVEKSGSALLDLFLFSPTEGITSSEYDPKIQHFGIDIVTKKDEPVKCIADGTVLISSWTFDTGNILVVQHKSSLISVYKHNAVLLKKVGDFVRGGEIISLVGNTGEYTTGPHLHFELWYNGNPVNPKDFVAF